MHQKKHNSGVLRGVRILDMATFVAAPFAATLCADLGAEVVKLELPGGKDPLRTFPPLQDGQSLYWKVSNRGKRGLTLDVRTPAGKEAFLKILPHFDVLVENFRTGTLDSWGLDFSTIHKINPSLSVLRLTGFGQTGPYKKRAGFARVFEAMSGLAHLTGEADGPPQHMNYPIGDMIAGVFGAFSITAALVERAKNPEQPGREIDLSATESIFRLLEVLPVEYDQQGTIRERTGSFSAIAAPSNVYQTCDKLWITLSASSDLMFKRLCGVMNVNYLTQDERYATLKARLNNISEVNTLVADWCKKNDFKYIESMLNEAGVPCSRINSMADIAKDPQFLSRRAIVPMSDPDFGTIASPCVVPRFSDTYVDEVPRSGPAVGEDTDVLLASYGFPVDEILKLRQLGII
ncbi:CaiB/BaiF CoA transferase family protein [Candidimonas nitroreducens]|nr:CoA transferase [Candidimonas nitroreducens]